MTVPSFAAGAAGWTGVPIFGWTEEVSLGSIQADLLLVDSRLVLRLVNP